MNDEEAWETISEQEISKGQVEMIKQVEWSLNGRDENNNVLIIEEEDEEGSSAYQEPPEEWVSTVPY